MPHPAMEDIFQKIAAAHGTSANEVKAQIQAAIIQGLSNPDPSVQKAWRSIPRQGETPAARGTASVSFRHFYGSHASYPLISTKKTRF